MFHWMLVAPQALKNVLPVADSLCNQELRTFCRIGAHQSASETFDTRLWRRKTMLASVNYFDIVALATNKTCGAFPWQVSVFSVWWLEHHVSKMTFHHNIKKNLFYISTNIPAFLSDILAGQRARRPISLPPVIASAISSIVFFGYTSWRSSATALLVEFGLFSSLRRSKSVTTCSSMFCPLVGSAEMSPLNFTATVI